MTDGHDGGHGRRRAVRWALVGGAAAVAALVAGLPWLQRDRLPDRLATHWSGGPAPDGSMPLWSASLVPSAVWLVLALALSVRWGRSWTGPRSWLPIALAPTGVVLVGAQISIVRANLDRADWHQARQPGWWIAVTLALAAAAGVLAWRLTVRATATAPLAGTPELDLARDERLVWFSRTANPWLQSLSAVAGLVAVGAALGLVLGLAPAATLWPVCAGCAVLALAGGVFSSVRAKVSEAGLEISFGPLGWPARRWTPDALESARAERRLPSQVGGWGYRLSGLGTTVMLRAGDCLVVRPRGRRSDFAVSVDDAERGAALLNALRARTPEPGR
ncbi:hypothetical protein GA0115256_12054 [Streptomyces sp. DconLS]|uniref:DUF1648 domain-containing protein n=1 Tax=unclassified Streptomyces TaxID=2593676 RepID=UPI00081D8092|nr:MULTISPECIES: DUF1648 domain-containing protein [unclassified Streptomyces]SCF59923.1 hypothetical protein GA0115258_103320 [Streptomyces sp. LamerLS-31b]SCF81176.1 hypothetical protein GA0115256_12054 [Streptomyces sp. DconLS]